MSIESFAIIKTGGKQYKVEKGTKLRVEKLNKKEGSDTSFSDVLLYKHGARVEVGTPKISGVKVVGRVLEHAKADKVITYKYRRRKRSSKKKGHRQPHTLVEIIEITQSATIPRTSTKKTSKK